MSGRLRSLYGASPLHLIAHLVWVFAAGWALLRLLDVPPLLYVAGWLIAAVVLHDAVLLPLYSVFDRLGSVSLGGAVNHVRVPAVLSGLLLLAYFPIIAGRGEAVFARVNGAGYGSDDYFERWLVASLLLFAASGLLYGVRAAASARSGPTSSGSTS